VGVGVCVGGTLVGVAVGVNVEVAADVGVVVGDGDGVPVTAAVGEEVGTVFVTSFCKTISMAVYVPPVKVALT
jgi:hypothetical protein